MASFVETITTSAVRERLVALRAERPEIETLRLIMTDDQFLTWAHTVAPGVDDELRALLPAIPPRELRGINANINEPIFLWSGLKDAEVIARLYRNHAKTDSPCVLEFGCGCCRSLRYMTMVPGFRAYGSDVNVDHIDWGQRYFHEATLESNAPLPPLKFKSEQFDLTYAFSVFTHLSERTMFAWLDELARVTAINGLLLLTTHGRAVLDTIIRSAVHQKMFSMSSDEAKALKEQLPARGIYYQPYGPKTIALAKAGDDYGLTYLHPDYISRHWQRSGLEVVHVIEGGMRGFQDVVILRRT